MERRERSLRAPAGAGNVLERSEPTDDAGGLGLILCEEARAFFASAGLVPAISSSEASRGWGERSKLDD